ncbi:hypothetical protein K6W36_10395 [Acetobacter senegalensis]|uniref:hypothetical protein n=1 Tax=Acetobacter senegalensis TaxID=446692 RepID=UPI001EDB4D26|nr:hypothetical protein [Acetobacter senegalensis]MCG4260983.1 hypothetical protein [Acetobacter senegalensis]
MRPDSLAAMDWQDISGRLDGDGWMVFPRLLDKAACHSLSVLYASTCPIAFAPVMIRNAANLLMQNA